MQAADLDEVLRIESCSMSHPWDMAEVAAELRAVNGAGWVVTDKGRVRGFAFFRTCPPECELLRLAIEPGSRHCGLGAMLLAGALACLQEEGISRCFLEVRDANTAARQLYRRAGFVQTGVRTNYYSQPVEDAVLLCRDLAGTHGGMA